MTTFSSLPTASTPIVQRLRVPRFASPAVGTGHASAKFILFGEHSVVYGHPAIALPLHAAGATATVREVVGESFFESRYFTGPLAAVPASLAGPVEAIVATLRHLERVDVPLWVSLHSDVPIGRGLGSSASVAGALVRGVANLFGHTLSHDDHFQLVQSAERRAHGNPSGIDARATVANAPVWFQDGRIAHLPVDFDGVFVVADTGNASSTRTAVADVRRRLDAHPSETEHILQTLGDLTFEASKDLAFNRVDAIGQRMSEAHALLAKLGVSSLELDHLVNVANVNGALGAKLTGGGQGGCLVAVASTMADAVALADTLKANGALSAWVHPIR